MEKVQVLIEEKEIKKRVNELAKQISKDYKGKDLVVVGILKGSVFFMADLSRRIKNENCIIDFIKVSSYGNKTESSGEIEFKLDMSTDPKDKDLLLIEDIVDSGYTLRFLVDYLKGKGARSIKTCTLLDKKSRRKVHFEADYIGFNVEDKFVVGYGLDFDQYYRTIPYVGYIDK